MTRALTVVPDARPRTRANTFDGVTATAGADYG